MSSPHQDVLSRYGSAVNALLKDNSSLSEAQLLKILKARDELYALLLLAAEKPEQIKLEEDFWLKLVQFDEQLNQHKDTIAQHEKYQQWRESFNPPEQAWWWYFKQPVDSRDQLDWLWSLLTIACITISFALVKDIADRFLSGSTGVWSSFAAIAPAVLTLLATGGALTNVGKETIEKGLEYFHIPKHHQHEAKFGLAVTVLALLFIFHALLPQIAVWYNNAGEQNYLTEEWSSAQSNFERALALQPDYSEAHFNLGLLYEDLQEFDKAKTQYQLAAQGDIPEAYNNLARLHILDEEYSTAIPLLQNGLGLTGRDESADPLLEYAIRKNLGWARFEQSRADEEMPENAKAILLEEAQTELEEAIRLAPEQGAAHCLLAQVLEAQRRAGSLLEWERCRQYASVLQPEEDAWLTQAKARLATAEMEGKQ
ncbi:tetratricopeptide repeat protein [Leptolyngbya sp. FACHB-541]|uniref:tetratricopeptide repeat protein n=1 Tax=Leptolyngbya sp. FACHB-541 TaxID=2692810 RepID=UPI0016881302|nr:tetratricopeptide repeat protein [Leptolyngbya sp. FACHB-541]MBD2001429.1 tetratricopeptide repeat protein [Leptolyngbya sp. FACHB-541]